MIRMILLSIAILMEGVLLEAQNSLRFVMDHEGKLFAIPIDKKYELNIPATATKSYIPLSQQGLMLQARYMETYKTWMEQIVSDPHTVSLLEPPEADRSINMLSLSDAYRPFFNPYTPMLRRANPMALDYNEIFIFPTAENTAVWAHGIQETWPGLGGMNIIETGATQRIGNVMISVSGFGGRFYTPYSPSPSLMGGLNIVSHYQVNDWMALKAWGSYTFYGRHGADPFMNINPLLNRTQVGGAMEFKLGDKAGIGVGVNFEYNHLKRKMEREYLIYPVGFGKKWGNITLF